MWGIILYKLREQRNITLFFKKIGGRKFEHQELRKIAREKLKNSVNDYIYKVDILLEHILHFSKTELIMNLDKEVSEQKCAEFELGIEELLKGKPIQYITNTQEFMKLNFFVDENVLIPQQIQKY